MSPSWEPSGAWKARFRKALNDAFNEPSMLLLTSDFVPPADQFDKISPPGFGKTAEFRLYELMEHARMNDWLLDLVAAAHERRPKNAELSAIAEELGLTIRGPRRNAGDPFEKLIQQ